MVFFNYFFSEDVLLIISFYIYFKRLKCRSGNSLERTVMESDFIWLVEKINEWEMNLWGLFNFLFYFFSIFYYYYFFMAFPFNIRHFQKSKEKESFILLLRFCPRFSVGFAWAPRVSWGQLFVIFVGSSHNFMWWYFIL